MPRKKQKRIATIDCETDPFLHGREPKPFVWGLYMDSSFYSFWGDDCAEQLLAFLADETDLIIYAHNGGKFDFFYLLGHLDPGIFVMNGRIAKATLFEGQIELRDSWLIIPTPLSAYKKDEINYEKFEREVRNVHKTEIVSYLRGDCVYLHNFISDFIDLFGLHFTIGGAAFHQIKKSGYEIPRTYEKYDDKFRKFYYGGRVQCFETGSFYGNYEYVDINSSYPYSMIHEHWYGTNYHTSSNLPGGENGSWFAEIRAKSFGALPYRYEEKKGVLKLLFPDDGIERTYFASGWEILTGLETGTLKIEKIIKCYRPVFKRSFSEFIDKYYELKKNTDKYGDPSKYNLYKLIQNSPYGKLAQDARKYKEFCIVEHGDWPENDPNWAEDKRWKPFSDAPNGKRIFQRDNPEDRFYNVPTAASITGFSRAYLWKNIVQNSVTPLYCDTDSIICKKFNGAIGAELGQWERECIFDDVHIAQKKMYCGSYKEDDETKYKIASKGVRFSDSAKEAYEILKNGIKHNRILEVQRDAPTYSLSAFKQNKIEKITEIGTRFIEKKIDLTDIAKNKCCNPPSN